MRAYFCSGVPPMRQRRLKNIEEKLAAVSGRIIQSPETYIGDWRSKLGRAAGSPLFLEIGSGKGQFLLRSAGADREGFYIGAEGLWSAAYRGIMKLEEGGVPNACYIISYLEDLRLYFASGELSGIFLNFSDPWPKKRHEKRRLTCPARLAQYAGVLAPGAFLRFKTDNDAFFNYSLGVAEREGAELGFDVAYLTRDLASSGRAAESPASEYEDRFRAMGKSISFLALTRR